jgi:hypothetical protein
MWSVMLMAVLRMEKAHSRPLRLLILMLSFLCCVCLEGMTRPAQSLVATSSGTEDGSR